VPGMIAVLQTDPALAEHLGRIATAQMLMTVAAGVLVALAVGAAFLSYKTFKTLAHTLRELEKVIDQLAPRAEPLIDNMTRIAVDAGAITDSVRHRVEDVMDTVDDINTRLREATDAAEQRVREFGAVLEVVQKEAEQVLLDAASTARGFHTAANTLRPRRSRRSLRGPVEDEDDE
jgi:uncharacterized protein YoxC